MKPLLLSLIFPFFFGFVSNANELDCVRATCELRNSPSADKQGLDQIDTMFFGSSAHDVASSLIGEAFDQNELYAKLLRVGLGRILVETAPADANFTNHKQHFLKIVHDEVDRRLSGGHAPGIENIRDGKKSPAVFVLVHQIEGLKQATESLLRDNPEFAAMPKLLLASPLDYPVTDAGQGIHWSAVRYSQLGELNGAVKLNTSEVHLGGGACGACLSQAASDLVVDQGVGHLIVHSALVYSPEGNMAKLISTAPPADRPSQVAQQAFLLTKKLREKGFTLLPQTPPIKLDQLGGTFHLRGPDGREVILDIVP